jgi:hypothetical protein
MQGGAASSLRGEEDSVEDRAIRLVADGFHFIEAPGGTTIAFSCRISTASAF